MPAQNNMNTLGGLSAFFYNIIPGVIFLFVLDKLDFPWFKLENLPGSDVERAFWIIVIGLFLGFFGQATVKFFKNKVINKYIFKLIKKEYGSAYDKAASLIKDDDIRHVFYGMDNHLRNVGTSYIINHYAERAAFWANISLGLIIIISILLYERRGTETPIFVLLLLATMHFAFSAIRSQYESVLQTFVQNVDVKSKSG